MQRQPARLLYPREVAEIFGVAPKTVARWARSGRLASKRTAGGHRRFARRDVNELRRRLNVVEAQLAERRARQAELEEVNGLTW